MSEQRTLGLADETDVIHQAKRPSSTAADVDAGDLNQLRHHHPAWKLLASRRAPVVVACLRHLFSGTGTDVAEEDAVEMLAQLFADNANDPDFELGGVDLTRTARRELRKHIRSGLLTERSGRLSPTDSLLQALRFVEGLGSRIMTSTASRLTTVQRQIDDLELRLSADVERRIAQTEARMEALRAELAALEDGEFEVLDGPEAVEAIREVYSLAMSLRDDFRRVEDSFQAADHNLRVAIISDRESRGIVLDRLMDTNDNLLETTEGQVFRSFHDQLTRSGELRTMSARLAAILDAPSAAAALDRSQRTQLRSLRADLVSEADRVVQARARSEHDVRNYLRSGLGEEHRRIGHLLDELLQAALDIDWSSQNLRRSPAPIKPVGAAIAINSPMRIRVKEIAAGDDAGLDFSSQAASVDDIDEDFWATFDGLDRGQLAADTIAALAAAGRPLTLAELADVLPPTHDLETLAVWVQMAGETGCEIEDGREQVIVEARRDDHLLAFDVPIIRLDHDRLVATADAN